MAASKGTGLREAPKFVKVKFINQTGHPYSPTVYLDPLPSDPSPDPAAQQVDPPEIPANTPRTNPVLLYMAHEEPYVVMVRAGAMQAQAVVPPGFDYFDVEVTQYLSQGLRLDVKVIEVAPPAKGTTGPAPGAVPAAGRGPAGPASARAKVRGPRFVKVKFVNSTSRPYTPTVAAQVTGDPQPKTYPPLGGTLTVGAGTPPDHPVLLSVGLADCVSVTVNAGTLSDTAPIQAFFPPVTGFDVLAGFYVDPSGNDRLRLDIQYF